jgi:hypothetical protein
MKEEKADHQAKPSRNSWDRPSASEVQASTYLIRFDQAAGAAKLNHEVASASRNETVSPGGQESLSVKGSHQAGDEMARGSCQMGWSKDGL